MFYFPSVNYSRPPGILKRKPKVHIWSSSSTDFGYLSSHISCLPLALWAPAIFLFQALELFVFFAWNAFLPDTHGTFCCTSVKFLPSAVLLERPFLTSLSKSSTCRALSSSPALLLLLVFNRYDIIIHICLCAFHTKT